MFVLCNLSLIQSFPPLCFFLSGAADARALAGSAALCFFFILPVPPVFFSRFSFCPDLPPLFSYPPLQLLPVLPFIAKTACVFYNENVQDHYCSGNGTEIVAVKRSHNLWHLLLKQFLSAETAALKMVMNSV